MSENLRKISFLDGLANLIRGNSTAETNKIDPTTPQAPITHELNLALDELKARIIQHREELAKQASLSNATEATIDNSTSAHPDHKNMLDQQIDEMFKSIEALHKKLDTGISSIEIEELQQFYLNLRETISSDDLDSRIRFSIAERLNKEISQPVWNATMRAIARSGLEWKVSEGMMPGTSAEEKQKRIERQVHSAEELFLTQPLQNGIENMLGIVSAWRTYPEADSWLWQQVAIRGVASTLRAKIFKVAVDTLKADGEHIRKRAHELLADNMTKIQSALKGGIHSLEDAERIVQGTDLVVQKLLPDLCWEHVRPTVEKEIAKIYG